MKSFRSATQIVLAILVGSCVGTRSYSDETLGSVVYPDQLWEQRSPSEVGLDAEKLSRFAERVGGDGCIIRDGYLIASWGDSTRHKDWASAAKPVLSTLLMLAVDEGKLASVDARVKDLGWNLSDKDSSMTFRHLANMTSGYSLGEMPGEAWGYNDFAIQLYAQSLERLYQSSLDQVIRDRLSALQFEDGEIFASRNGTGVTASSRDFARLGWLWLNRGRWKEEQIISEELFVECIRVGVPANLAQTKLMGDDYLGIGSYGGGTDQTDSGPGVYGFNFWFNEALANGHRVWPALPADAYQANGLWNRDTLTVIPSLKMVVASRGAKPGRFEPGTAEGEYNQNLKLIMDAILPPPIPANLKQAEKTKTEKLTAIDVSAFGSSIHHWRNLRDENRIIQVELDQPSYEKTQVREIVENVLLFQRENGGWPKDYDMLAVLSPQQRARVLATHSNNDASYDNGNLHSQVEYLARAIEQTGDPQWRAACERGFDFLLESQYPNGGFPQRYPNPSGYHAHITFNDGVMIGVVKVLQNAALGATHFQWLDAARRNRADAAVQRAVACILRCQIEVQGVKTGWCQQHDQHDFQPRTARSFELASICPQETTEIVKFLMTQSTPSQETIVAISSAIAWLQQVQLQGVRVEKIASEPAEFLRHTVDFDTVLVEDPGADPLWARHYEISSNRPIFAGRDGVKKYSLAEIERERRTGTPWYGSWPSSLLRAEGR